MRPTCMIWSNFLMESLLGPVSTPPSLFLIAPESCPVASDPVLEWPPDRTFSLGLLVLVGLVVGEEAGDEERGPGRGV